MHSKCVPVYCMQSLKSGIVAEHREADIRNRFQFSRRWTLCLCLLAALSPAGAAELGPQAVRGFDEYVRLAAVRMQSELARGGTFLWVDGLSEDRRKEAYVQI